MDEAEYCDRVSIMVDGRIDALDTPKRLKEKFKANSIDEVFINWHVRQKEKQINYETTIIFYKKRILTYFS